MASLALFSSCGDDFTPENILQMVYSPDQIPERHLVIENIYSYPWTISNKYYTANIDLCTTDNKTIGDQAFAENVQAMILYFDSNKATSFEQAKGWLPFLEQMEPEIQILLCDKCTTDTGVPRTQVLSWCLDHSFELVELNPEEDSDGEVEVDFKETTGIKRVIQALHSHTWPNLVLKDNPEIHGPYFRQMMAAEKADTNTTQNNITLASLENEQSSENSDENRTTKSQDCSEESSCSKDNTSKDDDTSTSSISGNKSSNSDKTSSKEKEKDNILGADEISLLESIGQDEDQDVENFEKLFSQMRLMKEKADGLPFDQRKAYAEKVALSFWKAIGGDEEEISGLSDSD